jgi:hypothetical protein
MYYLRMADQRMAFTSEVASNGPLNLVPAKDGKGFIIESQKGANLPEMVEALKSANVGNTEAGDQALVKWFEFLKGATVTMNINRPISCIDHSAIVFGKNWARLTPFPFLKKPFN